MTVPGQTFRVVDPGRGVVPDAISAFIVMGTAEKGTDDTVFPASRPVQVTDEFGEGPLSEMMAKILDLAGGPVFGMKLNGSIAGASGSVTVTRIASSTGTIAATQAPFDAYEVILEIVDTGTLGIGTFKYSLDDGRAFSEVIIIPSGGTFTIPRTNILITFTPGAGPAFFDDGDLFEFDTTAPFYAAADITAAFTALLLDPTEVAAIIFAGTPADSTAGAVLFATIDTNLTSMFNQKRFVRSMMDGGPDTAATFKTSFDAVSSTRLVVGFGTEDSASSKPFAGFGTPKKSIVMMAASRAAGSLVSTDLARVRDGAQTGVLEISDDEFRNDQGLNDAKFMTARTFQGRSGFYLTNGNLKSPAGSDFEFWQHGRLLDLASDQASKKQQEFLSDGVRTNKGTGTINEKDAIRWEEEVKEVLEERLLNPKNAAGNKGHASSFDYKIDRTNNVQATKEILADVSVVPLGYVKAITTTIGFTV